MIAVALLVCLVALTCFACKTKEVTSDDLGGRTYKFFTYNGAFYYQGYNFLFTYGIGEELSKYTFAEDTIIVEFNKDGSTGLCHYNYKNENKTYNFNYTIDEEDPAVINIEIPEYDIETSARVMQDFIVLETDDIIAEGSNVYLRLA